jgi:hypothetical protein
MAEGAARREGRGKKLEEAHAFLLSSYLSPTTPLFSATTAIFFSFYSPALEIFFDLCNTKKT